MYPVNIVTVNSVTIKSVTVVSVPVGRETAAIATICNLQPSSVGECERVTVNRVAIGSKTVNYQRQDSRHVVISATGGGGRWNRI